MRAYVGILFTVAFWIGKEMEFEICMLGIPLRSLRTWIYWQTRHYCNALDLIARWHKHRPSVALEPDTEYLSQLCSF